MSGGGASDQRLLLSDVDGARLRPTDWSSDGRFILFDRPGATTDIWVLPVSDPSQAAPFLERPFDDMQGQFSPDGQWVAYTSDESGQREVYVESFPGGEVRQVVSTGVGSNPRWRHDGEELYYVAGDGTLTAVPMDLRSGQVAVGSPERLFDYAGGGGLFTTYAVARDGQRFLVNVPEAAAGPAFTVVFNWTTGLEQSPR